MSIETHSSDSDVLIVSDSVRAGKRARELCDRLRQHGELNLSVWSLSALRLPALARAAAHEAESAIVLIVAVNGDETLPLHVKTCRAAGDRPGRGEMHLSRTNRDHLSY